VVFDDKGTVNDGSRAICIARQSRGRPMFRLAMPHSEDERFHPMYNLQQ